MSPAGASKLISKLLDLKVVVPKENSDLIRVLKDSKTTHNWIKANKNKIENEEYEDEEGKWLCVGDIAISVETLSENQ